MSRKMRHGSKVAQLVDYKSRKGLTEPCDNCGGVGRIITSIIHLWFKNSDDSIQTTLISLKKSSKVIQSSIESRYCFGCECGIYSTESNKFCVTAHRTPYSTTIGCVKFSEITSSFMCNKCDGVGRVPAKERFNAVIKKTR